MRSVTLLALCVVLGIAASGIGGCGDDLPDGTAAKVGDTTISTAAVQRQVASLSADGGSPDARRARAVRELILAEWVGREAKRRGLKGARGKLDAAQVERLRRQLLVPVSVDDKEIKRYYEAHRSEFGPPRRRTAWMLRTRTQADAQAARDNLNNYGSWSDTIDRAFARDETSDGEHCRSSSTTSRTSASVGRCSRLRSRRSEAPSRPATATTSTRRSAIRPRLAGRRRRSGRTSSGRLEVAKLERTLRNHYGDETDCAERFRVRAVPECA